MGRPSKLTPEQWADVDKRLAAGEAPSALAREFGVHVAQITRRGISHQSQVVRNVAQKVAEAQTALAELPAPQQYTALRLADKLRSISDSYASAAELGARTAHRLHALANAEVAKVDDAEVLSEESLKAMKGVAVLTKIGNDALLPATNLLAANKEAIQKMNNPEDEGAPQGVLVVPGVLQDADAWTGLVRQGQPKAAQ